MNENMSSLERIDVIGGLLDKLVDAQGRLKAGYIAVIDDFLNHIKEDILIMEEKIKDYESAEEISITIGEDSETMSPE